MLLSYVSLSVQSDEPVMHKKYAHSSHLVKPYTAHYLQSIIVKSKYIHVPEASSTVRALGRALVSVIITLLNDSERSLNKNGGAQ